PRPCQPQRPVSARGAGKSAPARSRTRTGGVTCPCADGRAGEVVRPCHRPVEVSIAPLGGAPVTPGIGCRKQGGQPRDRSLSAFYYVNLAGSCECKGWCKHSRCKHIYGLRKLCEMGLI